MKKLPAEIDLIDKADTAFTEYFGFTDMD